MTADEFRRLRLSRGLTQQEVANRLGISRGRVATWEAGRVRVPHDVSEDLTPLSPRERAPLNRARPLSESERRWMRRFAQNVRAEIARTGITQEDLSKRSGVYAPMLSGYLQCVRVPRLDTLIRIADALGVEPAAPLRNPAATDPPRNSFPRSLSGEHPRALRHNPPAPVERSCTDAWGDEWSVDEERLTTHGWPVRLGRPLAPDGRRVRHGLTTIITPELADYVRIHRREPIDSLQLPVSRGVIKRIRRLLGINGTYESQVWWEERSEDLASLMAAEFVRRHGGSEAAVSLAHKRIFGPKLRPAGWWREGEAAVLLASDLPRAFVAHKLDISIGAVGRLRWQLRREQSEARPDQLPPAGG